MLGNKDFIKMKKWIFSSILNGIFRNGGAGWIYIKQQKNINLY